MSFNFFTPYPLFSMLDADGDRPELFFAVSNRSDGKTVGVSRALLDYYYGADLPHLDRSSGEGKFVSLVRFKYQIGRSAEGRFLETLRLFHPGKGLVEVVRAGGTYSDIYVTDGDKREHVGYNIPISQSSKIKEISSYFTDVDHMWQDELIPEDGRYVPREVEQMLSIQTSIARGGGEVRRYLPIYFTANRIKTTNRYFEALSASSAPNSPPFSRVLDPMARRYRGPGFVYQNFFNEEIERAHMNSGSAKAFRGAGVSIAGTGWAFDQTAGITRPSPDWGPMTYVGTLKHSNRSYSLRRYSESGLMHISTKVDGSSPYVYRLTVDDHPNLPLLRGKGIGQIIRRSIESGTMTYESQDCYDLAMEFLT